LLTASGLLRVLEMMIEANRSTTLLWVTSESLGPTFIWKVSSAVAAALSVDQVLPTKASEKRESSEKSAPEKEVPGISVAGSRATIRFTPPLIRDDI
jgi:hypothetical protein